MERDRIISILREHQAELEAKGLLHLSLFGSVARGDNTSDSDVDLLYILKPGSFTLLDLSILQYELVDLLGLPVDLAASDHLRPMLRDRILQEAVRAF